MILGDILGAGYTIDPRVQGTITLSSGRPVSKSDVLFVLEGALRMSNVALVRDRAGYRLMPAAEATGSGFIDTADATQAGFGISVVPLRFVSAQAMLKLLDGFGVKPSTIRVDSSRNLLLIQGSGNDRRAAVDTILSFDGDWMRGQSVGVFPVHNSTPEPIIAELEKIMDSGEAGLSQNLIKFQAVARLNAILVVSRKPEYLRTAATWIKRLDAVRHRGRQFEGLSSALRQRQEYCGASQRDFGRQEQRRPRLGARPARAGQQRLGVLVRWPTRRAKRAPAEFHNYGAGRRRRRAGPASAPAPEPEAALRAAPRRTGN